LVDIICPNYNLCARFNGGANAGHTVLADGVEYKFHLLPSGMLHEGVVNVIGNGCVVDIEGMFEEMGPVRDNGFNFDDRFFVSERAQMVTMGLRLADSAFETNNKRFIGTT
jgi:adenylosuccinate synthase